MEGKLQVWPDFLSSSSSLVLFFPLSIPRPFLLTPITHSSTLLRSLSLSHQLIPISSSPPPPLFTLHLQPFLVGYWVHGWGNGLIYVPWKLWRLVICCHGFHCCISCINPFPTVCFLGDYPATELVREHGRETPGMAQLSFFLSFSCSVLPSLFTSHFPFSHFFVSFWVF